MKKEIKPKEKKPNEPMVLTHEHLNGKNGKRPMTSTERASHETTAGTVTDGEAG